MSIPKRPKAYVGSIYLKGDNVCPDSFSQKHRTAIRVEPVRRLIEKQELHEPVLKFPEQRSITGYVFAAKASELRISLFEPMMVIPNCHQEKSRVAILRCGVLGRENLDLLDPSAPGSWVVIRKGKRFETEFAQKMQGSLTKRTCAKEHNSVLPLPQQVIERSLLAQAYPVH